jgi:hypothetical protein
LNIIGSPFDNSQKVGLTHLDFNFNELYEVAQKNKIGLLFLESLCREKQIIIDRDELQTKLNDQIQLYKYLLSTAEKAATIDCKYIYLFVNMPLLRALCPFMLYLMM